MILKQTDAEEGRAQILCVFKQIQIKLLNKCKDNIL